MQVLKLADDLFEGIRSGEKLTTIRKGRRDVELGPLLLEGAEDETNREVVYVLSVLYTELGNVPYDVLGDDGFNTHEEALKVMQRFYPDITLETEVTSVGFLLPAE